MIEQLPHKIFTRVGDNLKMEVRLTMREALLGFEKTIMHLDGHEVELDRKNKVTKPGFIDKIANEGMPKADFSGEYGQLLVTY